LLDIVFSDNTLLMGLALATPLMLCALGGAVCSKAGNFNIALEGFMLIGAFSAVVGSYFFKSAAIGVLFAVAASTATALLYAVFLVGFKANEVILGFGFNMFAIAITGWLLGPIFGGKGSFYNPATPSLPKISIPGLSSIHFLKAFSGHNIIVYASWALIPVLFLLMYKTPLGYKMRALGENPKTLSSAGLSPKKYFYLAESIVGITCGLAGAFLSIGNLSMFTENMTAGRGFIAVAAVGFSNAYIPLAAFASIVFGIANAVAIQLQGLGMPTQFVDMIPYMMTILILVPSAFKKRDGHH
jgi:general nucleoside transport system permease protein